MVRNQVRVQVRYSTMTYETSRTDHTEIYSNYIGKYATNTSSAKIIQPSKLVVTIVKIRCVSNSKILENNKLQRERYDQENQL